MRGASERRERRVVSVADKMTIMRLGMTQKLTSYVFIIVSYLR